MRPSITVLPFAIALSACAHIQRPPRNEPETPQVESPNAESVRQKQPAHAVKIRARVKEVVHYGGFPYRGRHWLTGTAVAISDSTLTLQMKHGGGIVALSFGNIVELETKEFSTSSWRSVPWPAEDKQTLFATLGVFPPKEEVATALIMVAYVEESGIEVLQLHPDLGPIIDSAERANTGIFPNLSNFESAQYLRHPDGSYAVRLKTFDESGLSHVAIKPVSKAGLELVCQRIANGGVPSPHLIVTPLDAVEVRARVKDGVRYDGFLYSGKHWLIGTAIEISGSALTLKIQGSGGNVELSLDNIIQLEIRESSVTAWRNVPCSKDKQTLFIELGVLPVEEERAIPGREAAEAIGTVEGVTVAMGIGGPYGGVGLNGEICVAECRYSILFGTGLVDQSRIDEPPDFRAYVAGLRLYSHNRKHRTFAQLLYRFVDYVDFKKHYGVSIGAGYKIIAHDRFTFIGDLNLLFADTVGFKGPAPGFGIGYSW